MNEADQDRPSTGVSEVVRTLTRPVVTGVLVVVACAGFLKGDITAEAFLPLVTAAVAFWFGARGASS